MSLPILTILADQMNSKSEVPESLLVALDKRYQDEVRNWWEALSESQQIDFLSVARDSPNRIASPLDMDELNDDERANDWYEYVVNQDARFYYDRSQPPDPGTLHHIVYPIIAPVSNAADVQVVSYLLTTPRRAKG